MKFQKLFEKYDLIKIGENLDHLFDFKPSIDPIFGLEPKEVTLKRGFSIKHGNLLERTLLTIIKETGDWHGYHQPKFNFLGKKTKNIKIDTLVFNPRLKIGLFIECKRNLSNSDDGSMTRIQEYNDWCKNHSTQIGAEIEIPSTNIYFGVFDAYGKEPGRKEIPDIPVFWPEDLKYFLPKGLFEFLALVEHCIFLNVKKLVDRDLKKNPNSISEDYYFGNSLSEIEYNLEKVSKDILSIEISNYPTQENSTNFLQSLNNLTYSSRKEKK